MNQEKLVRICWNANNWQYPSGRTGKVSRKTSKAYEASTGYGSEEWLLDVSKLIDGFHYGHIQAISQHRVKYEGEKFDISFFTINSLTKERWWLGEIKNLIVVSGDESKHVFAEYKRNGWLREMYAQLEAVVRDACGLNLKLLNLA